MRGLLGVVLVLMFSAPTAVPAAPLQDSGTPHPSDGHEHQVTAFALPSVRPDQIARNAPGLDTLTIVGSHLSADGRRFSEPAPIVVERAAFAREQGLRTELLISSYRVAIDDFDPQAAAALLGDPQRIERAARQVARHVRAGDWDGVNVDIERLRRRDGPGLVRLLAALRAAVPATASVTVDVSPSGTLEGYRDRGYRLGEIARVVDAVQLMTYDEHGPGWSEPGPIGSLDWQRRSMEVALQRVPAAKLDLGVAGYGYLWRRDGEGRPVSVGAARRLAEQAGVTPRWRTEEGEWTARLGDGRVLWWSDTRSLELRRTLADDLGVRGLAIWRIGSADLVR